MKIELKGNKNRRARAVKIWLMMKSYYDDGLSVPEVLEIVRKSNGEKYSRQYFYSAMNKLGTLPKKEAHELGL